MTVPPWRGFGFAAGGAASAVARVVSVTAAIAVTAKRRLNSDSALREGLRMCIRTRIIQPSTFPRLHRYPHPPTTDGDRLGTVPEPDRRDDFVRLRIDARDGAVPTVGDPNAACADGDVNRTVADTDALRADRDASFLGREPRDPVRFERTHPNRAIAGSETVGITGNGQLVGDLVRARADSRDRVIEVRHPNSVEPNRDPAGVHDDDAAACVAPVVGGERDELYRRGFRPVFEGAFGKRGEGVGVALDLGGQVLALAAGVRDPEWDLEQREHGKHEREIREKQPSGHGRARRRSPTPRTVSIQPGSPSLRRSEATCTSTVFVGPNQSVFHTWRRIRSRGTTTPGSAASSASRSNSFGVSSSSRAARDARRPRGSISSGPTRSGCWIARPELRRRTARTRASSSRKPNGLTM